MQVKDYFQHLSRLLKEEKAEDLKQYREKMLLTSIEARRAGGVCWFPLRIRSRDYGPGERLMVEVERVQNKPKEHMFGSGKMVSLFAHGAGGETTHQISGVVNYVQGDRMMITLNEEEWPEAFQKGGLGVNLLFDDSSYKEMERSLQVWPEPPIPRMAGLRDVLLGRLQADFGLVRHSPAHENGLNESQKNALRKALQAEDVALIHGPPGTGKTTTLVRTIAATLEFEKQVLVVAPSNAAVDLLVEKLTEMHISVVRLGHPARVTEDILNRTYDALFSKHRYYNEIKSLKQRANQFFEMANAYKRKDGRGDRYQRKLLRNEAHQCLDEASQLEFYISRDILQSHQVVACTPVTASHSLLRSQRFSTLFIDEAAQALEPACWIPLRLADKVVLAGDHCQLPPTIKSYKAAKAGLEVTLFEKLMKRPELGVMLNEQYRMNERIMGFSARYFYQNELHAAKSVGSWQLTATESPLEFIDTAGAGYEESMDPETLSKFNVEEARMLLKRLEELIESYGLAYVQEQRWSIGIISPYKAQVKLLQEMSEEEAAYPLLQDLGRQCSINSIDGFQGQERDIIAITCVRSNDEGEIGFLAEERRMNVALTRARKKLIVIGDSATLASHPFYQAWLDYVQEKGQYRSVYELL